MKDTNKETRQTKRVNLKRPHLVTAEFHIRGMSDSPYVQHKFPEKIRNEMLAKHMKGSTAGKDKPKREAKDPAKLMEQATHHSRDGWIGIPAPSFRNAMISACRLVDFKMTMAKITVFIEADGQDPEDRTPLVRIEGEPVRFDSMTRNATGVPDVRIRPLWDSWSAKVRVRYDADQFTVEDVAALMMRAGLQVGIGEGRPDSKKSAGMGWGLFEVIGEPETAASAK